MNVISRVHEPTDRCTLMVVTSKASGEVGICVDLTKLNQSIKRESRPLLSVDFTLGKLGGSKVFSKIDANSGFWQRKLSDNSCLLTIFQKSISDILEGIEGAKCLVNNIVQVSDQVQHDEHLHAVLKRLAEANVALNLAKYKFSVTKIKVLGHVVSAEGI